MAMVWQETTSSKEPTRFEIFSVEYHSLGIIFDQTINALDTGID